MYFRLTDISNNKAEQWNNSKSGEEGRQLNQEGKWREKQGEDDKDMEEEVCNKSGAAKAFQMLKRGRRIKEKIFKSRSR